MATYITQHRHAEDNGFKFYLCVTVGPHPSKSSAGYNLKSLIIAEAHSNYNWNMYSARRDWYRNHYVKRYGGWVEGVGLPPRDYG